MTMNKYPRVMLLGRTNVGKSTLFNRLTGSQASIVFNQEGVTRDYIHEPVTWENLTFDLIDTGGLPIKKTTDPILLEVQRKVYELIESVDLILMIVDGKVGLVTEDRDIARIVHKSKKPVALLINKADTKASEENHGEFAALGFSDIFDVSATHGTGMGDVLNYIVAHVAPREVVPEESAFRAVILGKPNVGKSSLLNALLKEERAIVSEVPGTTREAIREKITFYREAIDLIDTAGVRRHKKVDDPLETLMVKSSLHAVREADLVIVVIDASAEKLSDQELKLLFYAYEQKKALVLLWNKNDLLTEESRARLKENIQEYDFILRKIPQISISCKTHKNISKVLGVVTSVWKSCAQSFDAYELDNTLKLALQKTPMYAQNSMLKLHKIRQLKGRTPTFMLYINNPDLMLDSHRGHIENILRKHYELKGCPVTFVIKKI